MFKTQRKVDALIKHLGLEFEDEYKWPDIPAIDEAKVFCPDENGITNRVEAIERTSIDINDYFVECKTCHCLLKKESAIKGEKRIEEKVFKGWGFPPICYETDKIVQDYFCGRCAPKGKRK